MTALLTMENAKLGDKVTASDYVAAPIESKLSLRPGERLSVADLLRGLMLESANDAAVTLAEHVARDARRVRAPDEPARARAEARATPTSPTRSGSTRPATTRRRTISRGSPSTLRRHSFIRKIADRTSATLSTGYRERTIRNRNTLLLKDRRVNGLKTGHTGDGRVRARRDAAAIATA